MRSPCFVKRFLLAFICVDHRERGVGPAIVDSGFKGPKTVLGVQILTPDKPTAKTTPYQKRKARKRFRRRVTIEPCIGHLKERFRLNRNWLKGAQGDQFNLRMAAAAFNFKKWMNNLPKTGVFLATYFKALCRALFSVERLNQLNLNPC